MKGTKKRSGIKFFVIILLVLALISLSIFILFNTKVFEKDNKQNNDNIEFKLPFVEKEYKNLVGYDFYTKENGTVLVKSSENLEIVNIYSDETIININEKVVKIEAYNDKEIPSKVLLLTENGNLYNLDLGQDVLNDSCLNKYVFSQKIKNITLQDIKSIDSHKSAIVELENGEYRVVGPNSILLAPSAYSLGKKISMLSLSPKYIVIENDDRIRIGDISTDRYFSISEEKWINNDADSVAYTYLINETGEAIKAKDFAYLTEGDISNIYVITDENKFICLSVSDKSLLNDDKILEKFEIKLSKIPSSFISNGLNSIVTIKFTDGTVANIKGNNLIFGMLSENNKFFTFSKQYLKDNIEYKILTDKMGVNYKIKDYQVIYEVIKDSDIYIINIFMITEDNNMIMTRISNDQKYNYINQMRVEKIESEKLIDKFDIESKIVFKDGTKTDFNTFVKKYLLLS